MGDQTQVVLRDRTSSVTSQWSTNHLLQLLMRIDSLVWYDEDDRYRCHLYTWLKSIVTQQYGIARMHVAIAGRACAVYEHGWSSDPVSTTAAMMPCTTIKRKHDLPQANCVHAINASLGSGEFYAHHL